MNTINATELKAWIKTNYASQVAPKSFAGMMIQAITDRIDQMTQEAQNEAFNADFGASERDETRLSFDEPVEPVEEVIEKPQPKTETDPRADAQKWVRRRKRR